MRNSLRYELSRLELRHELIFRLLSRPTFWLNADYAVTHESAGNMHHVIRRHGARNERAPLATHMAD
ncbi:hypothetical protein D3C80_1941870 [compost metagenome]